MASGEEKAIPAIFEKSGLEFLWRLRTDTKRRIRRLVATFVYYIWGEINLKFSSLEFFDL